MRCVWVCVYLCAYVWCARGRCVCVCGGGGGPQGAYVHVCISACWLQCFIVCIYLLLWCDLHGAVCISWWKSASVNVTLVRQIYMEKNTHSPVTNFLACVCLLWCFRQAPSVCGHQPASWAAVQHGDRGAALLQTVPGFWLSDCGQSGVSDQPTPLATPGWMLHYAPQRGKIISNELFFLLLLSFFFLRLLHCSGCLK